MKFGQNVWSLKMNVLRLDSFLSVTSNLFTNTITGLSKSESSSSLAQLTTNTIPTQEQLNNLDCINVAYDLYEQLHRLFEDTKQLYSFDLVAYYKDMLHDSLNKYLLELIKNSMQPPVKCTCEYIEAVMLTMHNEDLNGSQSTSAYVRELQQLLQRLCKDYFYLFSCKGKCFFLYWNRIPSKHCIR